MHSVRGEVWRWKRAVGIQQYVLKWKEKIGDWQRALRDGERQAVFWDQTLERTWQYFKISSISQVILLIIHGYMAVVSRAWC